MSGKSGPPAVRLTMVLRMSGVLGVWLPSMKEEEEVVEGGGAVSEQFSEIRSFRDILQRPAPIHLVEFCTY